MLIKNNIINQVNAKMGGINFNIDLYNAKFNKNNFIFLIIGLTSKTNQGKIIYSMTSSTNKYLNEIKTQIKEIIYNNKKNALKEMFNNTLKYFEEKNNKISPDYIIIYREGGNEYKNKCITIDEVNIFTDKMKELKSNNLYLNTKLYFICANLKAELKFYHIKEKHVFGNPQSGIIVDEDVVQKDRYEFYLQSQLVSQGTANPILFQVMYYEKNENNPNEDLSQDNLEKLTFYLSFYYWTLEGAVRIPALLKMAITALDFCIKCNIINDISFFEKPIYI